MSGRVFWLVLLVSLSHAMVHVFELMFPSVETTLAEQWTLSTLKTGMIGQSWAMPFGFGAVAAGWFADRFGAKRTLLIYLVGCSLGCAAIGTARSVPELVAAMIAMGACGSLYHPAGLAYISRITPAKNLGAALGIHGVFGSAGVAVAPLVAAVLLGSLSWQGVYWALVPAGLVLAMISGLIFPPDHKPAADDRHPRSQTAARDPRRGWGGFWAMCIVTLLFGLIYRGFLTFLPRFLDGLFDPAQFGLELNERSARNLLTGAVLAMSILGQLFGGWLADRFRGEAVLVGVVAANIPVLLWMGVANGHVRLFATGLYAVVHFMLQPVQNSLIAQFTPVERRSLGYGISNLVSFGLGSFGATYAGYLATSSVSAIYPGLSIFAVLALGVSVWLLARARMVDNC